MKTSLPFALLSSLLFASTAMAEPRQRAVETVRIADLDLGTAKGRASLDSRIRQAVNSACGLASPVDLAGANDIRHCRAEARRLAQRQVDRALASAGQATTTAMVAR
jgi:UrcA family protein